jgi:hypothetical protein
MEERYILLTPFYDQNWPTRIAHHPKVPKQMKETQKPNEKQAGERRRRRRRRQNLEAKEEGKSEIEERNEKSRICIYVFILFCLFVHDGCTHV